MSFFVSPNHDYKAIFFAELLKHSARGCLTVCDIVPEGVLPEWDTRKWAGVDSAREQEKPEARKMLINRAA